MIKNTPSDPKRLERDIIHEAVVGCVTSFDNVTGSPLSVEYCTKSWKTGGNVYKTTKYHIRQLQVSYSCLEKTKSD